MSIVTLKKPLNSEVSISGSNNKHVKGLRSQGKAIVDPRVNFNKHNIEKTTKIESQKRTYGFKKANSSYTPHPKKANINKDILIHRLRQEHVRRNQEQVESHSSESFENKDNKPIKVEETLRSSWIEPQMDENLSFTERRKRFYEAEYTITQGVKLTELQCQKTTMVSKTEEEKPKNIEPSKSLLSTIESNYFLEYNDMEALPPNIKIKFTDGFDF